MKLQDLNLDKKDSSREELIQNIVQHIIEISQGNCAISDEMILSLSEQDESLAEVLSGLQILHETIVFQNKRLREFAKKVIAAQEEERRNLSRDVHDDLGQLLAALNLEIFSLKMEVSDNPSVEKKIASLEENLALSLKSLRNLSSNLRAHELHNLGLSGAIENHLVRLRQHSNIDFAFFDGKLDFISDKGIETTLYRIFQESITNVVKHAQANRVEILLRKEEGYICMEIQDNGKGFVVSDLNKKESFGLVGMRERAGLFGGSVDIFNRKSGKGVCVKVKIPY